MKKRGVLIVIDDEIQKITHYCIEYGTGLLKQEQIREAWWQEITGEIIA